MNDTSVINNQNHNMSNNNNNTHLNKTNQGNVIEFGPIMSSDEKQQLFLFQDSPVQNHVKYTQNNAKKR